MTDRPCASGVRSHGSELPDLNLCTVAHDLLPQLILEEKADIVIISEQLRDEDEPNWVTDSTSTAAIWICGELHVSKKMDVLLPKFTRLEVSGIRLYSCYLPPSDSIGEIERSLNAIVALSVFAGLPPLDLMARERAVVYREGVIREEGNFDQGPRVNRWSRKTVEEWQRR